VLESFILQEFVKNKLSWAATIILSGILIGEQAYSQSTGFIPPTEEQYNALPLKVPYFNKIKAPPEQETLMQYFPRAGEQATQHACMGFAWAYGMTTALEAKASRQIPEPYSAAFLYNSTKQREASGICSKGVKSNVVLEVLQNHGVPLESEFPFQKNRCDVADSRTAGPFTRRRKLKNIKRINGPDADQDIVLLVKDTIASAQQPVVIGMPTGKNFNQYRRGVYPSNFEIKREDEKIEQWVMTNIVVLRF